MFRCPSEPGTANCGGSGYNDLTYYDYRYYGNSYAMNWSVSNYNYDVGYMSNNPFRLGLFKGPDRNVLATNFPVRARALAAEVDRAQPDVLGLQEVTLWRDQSPADVR